VIGERDRTVAAHPNTCRIAPLDEAVGADHDQHQRDQQQHRDHGAERPVQRVQELVVGQGRGDLEPPAADDRGRGEGRGRQREHDHRARQDAGHRLRQHDAAQHGERPRAQRDRRVLDLRIEALQGRPHRQHHVRHQHVASATTMPVSVNMKGSGAEISRATSAPC
jgi:hypothetical protein